MSKEIEVIIDEDGTVHIEAIGFNGKGCHEVVSNLAKALGKAKNSKKKAEFYQDKVTVGNKIKR